MSILTKLHDSFMEYKAKTGAKIIKIRMGKKVAETLLNEMKNNNRLVFRCSKKTKKPMLFGCEVEITGEEKADPEFK